MVIMSNNRKDLRESMIGEAAEAVFESFSRMEETSKELTRNLRDAVAIDYRDTTPTKEALRHLVSGISDFYYQEGQDSKTTNKYPGAIACSQEALNLAAKLNKEKIAFGEAFRQLAKLNTSKTKAFYADDVPNAARNYSSSREALRFSDIARICQKQCVRTLPIAKHRPQLISWHWIEKPVSITTMTRNDAIELLKTNGVTGKTTSEYITRQIDALKALPANTMLEKKYSQKNPVIRVSHAWGKGISDRQITTGSLPLLFLKEGKLPTFKPAPKRPGRDQLLPKGPMVASTPIIAPTIGYGVR